MRLAALRRQLPARLECGRAQGPAVEAEHHHRLARQLGRDGNVARWRLLLRSIWQPVRASEARAVWAPDGARGGRRRQDLTSERRRSRHANSPGEPPPALTWCALPSPALPPSPRVPLLLRPSARACHSLTCLPEHPPPSPYPAELPRPADTHLLPPPGAHHRH